MAHGEMLCRVGIKEHMYGDAIMVKEVKTTAKGGAQAPGKESEGIDFFYILAGGGGLIGAILVIFVLLHYVFHVL
jgi:hypothetical protein